jgi:Bacterial surface proteins containing Ig-like domains
MKKNNLILTAMLAIALSFTACSSSNDNPAVEVSGILLDKTTLSLVVAKEYTLTATILPNNAADKTITWTSSNPAVASVASGKIIAISTGTATIVAQAGGKNAVCEVSVDGVKINGVVWATRNVDMPGAFSASPESYGMFYQWGMKIGWSVENPLVNSNGGTTWDSSNVADTIWETASDPSPAGWRVPTRAECLSLLDETKVTSVWTTQNGVTGRKFTDIATSANIFLPAVGYRSSGLLNKHGSDGIYWSSTAKSLSTAMYFSSSEQYMSSNSKSFGHSVRSVAE